MGDRDHRPARKRWGELSRPEKRRWLAVTGVLGLLALTLALHPSSAVRDVVVWSSFLFVLFRRRKALFSKRPDALSLAILVYMLLVVASVAYSVHPYWSLREASKFLSVLAMVFAAWHLFKKRVFFFAFLQLLVGAVLLVCLYDVVNYFLGLGTRWEWGERWEFAYYGHPNPASAILMILMPFSVFLFVASRRALLKGMHACFVVAGLFLTYAMASRTVQLSLAAMVLCGALLIRPLRRKIAATGVVVCLLVLVYLNIRALNPRFLEESVNTLSFREENWRDLRVLISRRPVFGYGFGKRVYREVYHDHFQPEIRYEHAHSLLLQTAFETGAVGLGAMIGLWLTTVCRLIKAYVSNRNRWGQLMATLLVAILGMSIYCLAEVPDGFLRSLFWLLIAMAGAVTTKGDDGKLAVHVVPTEAERIRNTGTLAEPGHAFDPIPGSM
jgi:O-antigen ligase